MGRVGTWQLHSHNPLSISLFVERRGCISLPRISLEGARVCCPGSFGNVEKERLLCSISGNCTGCIKLYVLNCT